VVSATPPRAARHALAYVLNNWRRHGKDHDIDLMFFRVDPFSSATSFGGWKESDPYGDDFPSTYEPLPVSRAETWLLNVGWKRHGLISVREVPGPEAKRLVA